MGATFVVVKLDAQFIVPNFSKQNLLLLYLISIHCLNLKFKLMSQLLEFVSMQS